jgi:hypothetical protein
LIVEDRLRIAENGRRQINSSARRSLSRQRQRHSKDKYPQLECRYRIANAVNSHIKPPNFFADSGSILAFECR